MAIISALLGFFISLIISAIIIYLATKLMGEEEEFGTAVLTAFIGAIIFALVSYFLGVGLVASLVGGLAWLLALGSLYKMGWLKSFAVSIIIWIFAAIVSWFLPTLAGPF